MAGQRMTGPGRRLATCTPIMVSGGRARSARWLALLVLAVATGGCGAPPAFQPVPPPARAFAWRTMRARHLTRVTARLADGRTVVRRVRGLLAVKRPDRLRLRALGPGDITLFEVLGREGRCRVLTPPWGDGQVAPGSPPAARQRAVASVLQRLCHDLRLAFRLTRDAPGRQRILYGDWRPVGRSREPFRLRIEDPSAGFTADIEVVDLAIDVPLDDALFRLPPPAP